MSDIFKNMPVTNSVYYQNPSSTELKNDSTITVKSAIQASNPLDNREKDTLVISEVNSNKSNKTEKKGPIKKLKSFIAEVKKFFASLSEYFKGTVRGVGIGAALGSVVYTAGSIVNYFKSKAAVKAGSELTKKVPNKVLACIVAVIALASSLWKASLDASDRRSDIDHRWTGHDN